MPNPEKNDPEFLPMGRPCCPQCQTRMITSTLVEEPEGFERRTYECLKCGHSEQKVVRIGWMKTHAVTSSGDAPNASEHPIKTHEVDDGRMIPRQDK